MRCAPAPATRVDATCDVASAVATARRRHVWCQKDTAVARNEPGGHAWTAATARRDRRGVHVIPSDRPAPFASPFYKSSSPTRL
mmetsp:Transcript_1135/g.4335  ORF Transcript_1135/g.4335 Transcript_1135/m.4335 type:complete len:84 (-) Transcript_1135:70-321(-)